MMTSFKAKLQATQAKILGWRAKEGMQACCWQVKFAVATNLFTTLLGNIEALQRWASVASREQQQLWIAGQGNECCGMPSECFACQSE
jgi:hypothetical protein